MHCFGARQASIDYHLEMARKCLALSVSQRSPASLNDDLLPSPSEEVVEQHGSRIAAKITHLRDMIAAHAPSVPATTEANQNSVLDRFRASVETLWSDRREHDPRDRTLDSQPRLAHANLPMVSRRSLEFSSIATSRHRRAGSSRI